MTILRMNYGRDGLTVDVSEEAAILRTREVPGVLDEITAVQQALRNPIQQRPLRDQVQTGSHVVVIHSDITRSTPNSRLLPVILDELEAAGVKRNDILLINALGTHRQQTIEEQKQLLGEKIVANYHCVQHDAFDDAQLESYGTTSFGHPVRLNRCLKDADLVILTGFIEPHFFAGFSGGAKAILPGLAGSESVLTNHGYKMIADPRASFNTTQGNPIWEEMREVASMVKNTFLVNVTLNKDRRITGVFAGDITAAHGVGCDFLRQNSMVDIDTPFDVVVTSNSGYPLDQNLYQCVKGLAAAKRACRKGGAIIMAAQCEDGLPDHGLYASLLKKAGSPERVLQMVSQPGFSSQDSWQVQIQAYVQIHADVYVYSEGLSDQQITDALMHPCRDFPAALHQLIKKYGPRVCYIPEGPLVIVNQKQMN